MIAGVSAILRSVRSRSAAFDKVFAKAPNQIRAREHRCRSADSSPQRKVGKVPVLVFLVESPFSQRDFERFAITLLSARFEVLVLDLTPVIKPHFWAEHSSIAYRFDGYVAVHDLNDLTDVVPAGAPFFVVDMISDCREATRIRKICRDRGAALIAVQGGLLPTRDLAAELWSGVRRLKFAKIAAAGLRRVGKLIKARPSRAESQRQDADIVFLSGVAGRQRIAADSRSRLVPAHSFDYDIFLASRASERPFQWPSDYAVFLDEDMVFHSDFLHHGIPPPITAEDYFPAMRRFFTLYEEVAKRKVVIAAHPRSDHDRQRALFGSFDYVVADTARLVQHASDVLLHQSTSCSFAVLWHKPMLFLTMPELEGSWIGARIRLMSDQFGASPINVEDAPSIVRNRIGSKIVDASLYSDYQAKFIKYPGSPELPLWEIVADTLDKEVALGPRGIINRQEGNL